MTICLNSNLHHKFLLAGAAFYLAAETAQEFLEQTLGVDVTVVLLTQSGHWVRKNLVSAALADEGPRADQKHKCRRAE